MLIMIRFKLAASLGERFPLVLRLIWAWFGVSICLLDCMLLRRRMYLPPLALFVLLS